MRWPIDSGNGEQGESHRVGPETQFLAVPARPLPRPARRGGRAVNLDALLARASPQPDMAGLRTSPSGHSDDVPQPTFCPMPLLRLPVKSRWSRGALGRLALERRRA